MRQLILVRHGKSSWDHEGTDKERPLTKRGQKDVRLVAEKFSEIDIQISCAFSSPANRTLHTAMIFLTKIKFHLRHFMTKNVLYDFPGLQTQKFIENLENVWNTVIIFGHNHALTYLANYWGDELIEHIPTGGLVHIAFDVEGWEDIYKEIGTTENIIFPKHLKS